LEKYLIAYYSWVGSTEVVAKYIAEKTNIPIVRIEEVKKRPLGSMMSAAMGAFFGTSTKLKPIDLEMEGVQTLILCAQVWAGKTAPAINTYLKKASFRGKQVWVVMTMGDDTPPLKTIESIAIRIAKKGGTVKGHFGIQTHWDPKTNVPITREEIEGVVDNWLLNEGFLKQ